jgi:hypothetical protein
MAKAPSLPAIVIANDLLDGDVIFLGAKTWEATHRKAEIAHTQEEADALLARAHVDFKANRIVDPYLAVVTLLVDGTPEPLHYREKMRTKGPTTRIDLGKQAEF